MQDILSSPAARHKLVHYSYRDEAANTNAAFLLASYLVLVEGWTPQEAAAPFERIKPSPFKPFRDVNHPGGNPGTK